MTNLLKNATFGHSHQSGIYMKVYILGQKGIPAVGGGVERHVDELATKLAKNGPEVFVYARKGYTLKDVNKYNGVNIIYTPAIYSKHLEAISHTLFSILDLMKREADIIHFQSIGPCLLIPLARIVKPKAKIVATVHSPDYNHQKWGAFARFALRMGEKFASKMADTTITVSKGLQAHVKHAHRCEAVYIPNGVPIPELNSDPELLKEWNLEPGQYIVAISRLIRHKGLHFLIEAYKKLETDKKLVIVGGAEYTDDYVRELHAMAESHDNIVFTGKQGGEKLAALFEHAYIFVQPSLSEGLSIALLEALSYKQAVLASDIPENMEAMETVGLTFTAGSANDLAKKLTFLLTHPEIVKRYKEMGQEHVKSNYNWNKIAEKTYEVYVKALKETPFVTTKEVQRLMKL